MDNPLLLKFITITIFSLMLSNGVTYSFQQLISLSREPEVLLRSLLAVLILVPIGVVLLLWVFDLPPAVAIGLAILAAAPGAPMITKRAEMTGGDLPYAASLQLALALLAVVITPLTLALFYALFQLESEHVTLFRVARQVATVTFLPVIIGLLLQRFAPRFTERISKPLRVFSNVLFLLLVVLVVAILALVPDARMMLQVGGTSIAAMVIMVLVGLSVGHLLGGPKQEQRATLAVASIARNVGLAMYIAGLSKVGQASIPTIVVYMLVGVAGQLLYKIWSKRRTA
jgi:BASS family bile acid:Na+ symporter